MAENSNLSIEELYSRGLAQFRAADWSGAIQTFTILQSLTSAYPELDSLIADAQLKQEMDRVGMPEAAPPPKERTLLRPRFLTAVPVLLILGAVLIALRPAATPPPEQPAAQNNVGAG